MDVQVVALLYVIKLLRSMTLWISLFVVEKVFQDAYMQAVYVNNTKPPDLTSIMVYAIMLDAVFVFLILTVVVLLRSRFETPNSGFIIDGRFMAIALFDYFATTSLLVALGSLLGNAVQNKRLFRYSHDGMRGIRALCTMLLYMSFIVMALPFFVFV